MVMVTYSPVVSLPFSDHNTQQTNTNNSDSNAEEDIQVREQKLRLFVHWGGGLLSIDPVLICLFALKRNDSQSQNNSHFLRKASDLCYDLRSHFVTHTLIICAVMCDC